MMRVVQNGELLWRADTASHTNFEQRRGRFLGYAGFPMILTIPCLFLSAAAARRVLQLHHNNQHSRLTGPSHLGSQLCNEENATSGRLVSPFISPDNTTPGPVDPETLHSMEPTGPGADVQGAAPYNEPDVLPSQVFPTFVSSHKRSDTWGASCTIEEDDECDPRRQIRGMLLSCKLYFSNRV